MLAEHNPFPYTRRFYTFEKTLILWQEPNFIADSEAVTSDSLQIIFMYCYAYKRGWPLFMISTNSLYGKTLTRYGKITVL